MQRNEEKHQKTAAPLEAKSLDVNTINEDIRSILKNLDKMAQLTDRTIEASDAITKKEIEKFAETIQDLHKSNQDHYFNLLLKYSAEQNYSHLESLILIYLDSLDGVKSSLVKNKEYPTGIAL